MALSILAIRCLFETSGTNFDRKKFPLLQAWLLANLGLLCSMAKGMPAFCLTYGGGCGMFQSSPDMIICKPICIVTESQVERNQHRNRELAMKSLRAKLYERQLDAVIKETSSSRKMQIGTAGRSEKVRTYNSVQDRITDHRAHITVHGVQSFLRGEEDFENLSHMIQQWHNIQSLADILNKYNST
ncbi:peptide chain release factor 1-like, mitochondrial [Trichonephila clavipes]|nr:peptide chain release factor 1-like, mitochondrial [Trichonephila clavipes]